MMESVSVIEGEIFSDIRGKIFSLNNFHFEQVKRCYFIHHPDENIVRGWNGHKNEHKWFYCIKGAFSVALVRIDNWHNPSENLMPEIHNLSDNISRLVSVPTGYANCLKAHSPGSIMLVLSDKTIEESKEDNWKYDSHLWVDWDKINNYL